MRAIAAVHSGIEVFKKNDGSKKSAPSDRNITRRFAVRKIIERNMVG
jgi:hypothetical protein